MGKQRIKVEESKPGVGEPEQLRRVAARPTPGGGEINTLNKQKPKEKLGIQVKIENLCNKAEN